MDSAYYMDNLDQIAREAERLANEGMHKQACTMMSIVLNQPIDPRFFHRVHGAVYQPGSTGSSEAAAMRWSYRMETLRELMYDQDMELFFNTVARLVRADKRDDAAVMLSDFSDLLRLGLKSSSVEESVAETELKILENYLRLSRSVSGDRFSGMLHTLSMHEWGHFTIPAMAMVPMARRIIQFLVPTGPAEVDFRVYADDNVRFLCIEIQIRQTEDTGIKPWSTLADQISSAPWCSLLYQGWAEFYKPDKESYPVFEYKEAIDGFVYRLPFCDSDH